MINEHITIPQDEIIAFCQKYPIRKLSLFGSVLREDFRPDSDIDVLVEFESSAVVTYFDMGTMESELGYIFERKVDLREPEELNRHFRQQVLETAIPLYG